MFGGVFKLMSMMSVEHEIYSKLLIFNIFIIEILDS